jgi:H+-translocating NAD(P) transhydrogenase subunit alpha
LEEVLKIGIPKEIAQGETRVALTPSSVSTLIDQGHDVYIEAGTGEKSCFDDTQYEKSGAKLIKDVVELYKTVDVIMKVRPPQIHSSLKKQEAELLQEGSVYIGFMDPFSNPDVIKIFSKRQVTSFSMELIPRITRAQNMDALSSMATLAGFRAVISAAEKLPKIFPLMMTAAGTLPPSTVFVLGAGVAGLQAIATAKRLGARVEAFDPRPAVKEQVQSVGASFVEMEITEDVTTEGGYAKEQSEEFLRKEREVIGARFPKIDVVITTAQVFGKRPPILITEDMLKKLKPGSVIVDLAAEQGGNCELTKAGSTIEKHGVTIIGEVNLPATVPIPASMMYSKNITNLFTHLYNKQNNYTLDFTDEITKASCVTHGGEIVNEIVKNIGK